MAGGRSAPTRRLCVVTPYPPAPSETFIRHHVSGLGESTLLVHGWRPSVGEGPALPLAPRVLYKARRVLLREGMDREVTAAFIRIFQRHQAQAVLAEYGPTGVRTSPACRQLDIPLIVHFHGFDASVRSVLEQQGENYARLFRDAGAIVAVSQAMREGLVALGAPAWKVHYNPCGVDCAAFSGASPADASPRFVAVGRFVEKKAPQHTIAAFAEVARVRPEARLRMIGDGPLLDECRGLAAALGVGHAVEFLGVQPPEIVQREMRGARCFVQHSIRAANGDCEGTPVGIVEAGATGLPVVATRHGGIPDVVVEGETGLLVDEHDVRGMAREMLALAAAPGLAGRMGARARARVEARFSLQTSLSRLSAIIESAPAPSRAAMSLQPTAP
jgi:glycosyltransferase involved in cell wall biosynthesis